MNIQKIRHYLQKQTRHIDKLSIFRNKYILYISIILAALRLLDYLINFQYLHIFYYFLTALSTYFFTNNLTVICLVTFVVTSFTLCKYGKEGLENQKRKKEEVPKPTFVTPTETDSDDPQQLPVAESFEKKNTPTSKKQPRLDYASTVEDSYKMLDKMLTSEGIQNLNSDTKDLLKHQKKLSKMMEGMGPLMETAKDLLKKFNPK